MKTLKLLTVFLTTSAFIAACSNSDSDTVIYEEENPRELLLSNSGLNNVQSVINSIHNYEAGLRFKPTVKGTINKITIQLPAAQSNLRITIWDAVTETVLRTETIETVIADVETSKTITPFALQKNKEYTISFNANDWYQRDNTNSEIPYPITAGNILITGFLSGPGDAQAYPSDSHSSAIAGDLSFAFQRTQ